MLCQSEADAGFYALVHGVLEAEKEQYRSDRRDETRQPFECMQLIAPYREGQSPASADFRHVRCRNLSARGMSFLDDAPPDHRQILVLLGRAPFTVLTAEIVHQVLAEVGDCAKYIIGCKFTGRLQANDD